MSEGPLGPATFWLEAIRHEMAALVGLVSEVASRDLTPVVHVESGGSDSTPALLNPIDLQPLIDAIRNAPAPVVQAADLSPLLEKLDEIAHVSRGLGSAKGGGGPSFVTSQVRNEPGQTLHVTVDAQPAGSSGLTNTELRAAPVPVSNTSLPLPTGASTEATLSALNTKVPSALSAAPGSDTGQAAIPVRVISQLGAVGGSGGALSTSAKGTTAAGSPTSTSVDANTQALHTNVTNLPAVQAVSAAALPLPAGAATSSAQTDGTQKTQVTNFPATQPVSGTVSVSNFPATQPVSIASTVPVSGTFWQATQPVSLATNTPDVTDRAARLLGHVTVDNASIPVTGAFFQATQPVVATAMTDGTQVAQIRAATSYTTVVSTAISLGATLTLPAAGAGLFHYITSIEITNYTGIARTGGATPVTVTTTNLTGSPAYTFASAAAIGTTDRFIPIMCAPVKSAVANTATTIVCPVTTGSFWRINVTYYTAA